MESKPGWFHVVISTYGRCCRAIRAFFVLDIIACWRNGMHGSRLAIMVGKQKCGVTPILSRQHRENVFGYLLRHEEAGAWTWSIRKPAPSAHHLHLAGSRLQSSA